jgi:hypothetical protein
MLDNQLFKQIAAKLSGFYLLLVVVGLLSSQLLLVLLIGTLLLLFINLKEFHKLVIWVWQSPQKKYQSNNSSWDNI